MRLRLVLSLPYSVLTFVVGATWDVDIWASIEVNIGLICASAPALKPLIRKILPNLFASRAERSSGRNNNAFPNVIGYLRASSRNGLDSAVELTDRDHNKVYCQSDPEGTIVRDQR